MYAFNSTWRLPLSRFDDYEGCANLVYQFEHDGQPRVLRISYRPDRSVEHIQAELHFVKGRGMRVPDNGYRYREGVPIDDSCYLWFIYDLACAWEGGIGRIMFRPLAERQAFMAHYMEQIMAGYTREKTLSNAWLARLPLFLRLIQMQELMHFAQYLDEPDEEVQAQLRYQIRQHHQSGNLDGNWVEPAWEYMHSHPYLDNSSLDKIGVWEEDGEIVAVAHREPPMTDEELEARRKMFDTPGAWG